MHIIQLLYVRLLFKMLPVTELMNIPDAAFVKSTQSSATTEHDTTNHILENHWTKCHLWVPHRASYIQLINIHKRGRLPVIKNLPPPLKWFPPVLIFQNIWTPRNIYFTGKLKYMDPSEIVGLPWVLIFWNIWTPQNIYFRAGLKYTDHPWN